MNLYVPEIGDCLKLTADWTFGLHHDYRNRPLAEHFNLRIGRYDDPPLSVTIPAGTVLKVDRIYIRKGNQEFSSITFYSIGIGQGSGGFGRPKSARFFAKLSDCNKIEFEIQSLKNSEKPPLGFGYFSLVTKNTQQRQVNSVIPDLFKDFEKIMPVYIGRNYMTKNKAYDIVLKYRISYIFVNEGENTSYFGASTSKYYVYDHITSNITYTLIDSKGNVIGTYQTGTAVKKAAKDHYEKSDS